MKTILSAFICIVVLSGCQQNGDSNNAELTQAPVEIKSTINTSNNQGNANLQEEKEQIMTLTGTVAYQNMEGGFYGFVDNKGNKYTPMNLSTEHRKNGLVIQVSAKEVVDMMTTTQFGQLIEVTNIKVLDDSKVSPINNTY